MIVEVYEEFKDLIAGFDMVCEEDKFDGLLEYAQHLFEAKHLFESKGYDIPFYFHCITTIPFYHLSNIFNIGGESSEKKNMNIYDAILLGTKRIGHGFKILNHPYLMEIIKKEKICIECCPISNNVLGTKIKYHL